VTTEWHHNHHPDDKCGEHCPAREFDAIRAQLAASESRLLSLREAVEGLAVERHGRRCYSPGLCGARKHMAFCDRVARALSPSSGGAGDAGNRGGTT
jgi:hypothetical protein